MTIEKTDLVVVGAGPAGLAAAARAIPKATGAAGSSESLDKPIPNNAKYHNWMKSSDCRNA